MTLAITRLDLTADDLRRAARSSRDVAQSRHCLAIASVLRGQSRTAAAASAGMQRQTLRDWVHRYNAEGIAGLLDRPRPVRSGLLNAEQRTAIDAIVEAGPDVAVDGVVRADEAPALAPALHANLSLVAQPRRRLVRPLDPTASATRRLRTNR